VDDWGSRLALDDWCPGRFSKKSGRGCRIGAVAFVVVVRSPIRAAPT
jgi:hypothetical protein